MALLEEIKQFAEEVRKDSPAVRTEVMAFPSGAVMLDVFREGRMFVLAYLPSYSCFGVDEVQDDDGIGTWYRYGFADFPSAKDKLLQLMKEPLNGRPA